MSLEPPASLAAPLASNQNATLVFEVSDAGGSVDDFGNYIPNVTDVIIQAIAHQSRDSHDTQLGVDLKGVVMRGRCTSPKTFPSTVKSGMRANANINGEVGSFTLIKSEGNPYTNGQLGDSFVGVFLRESP